MSRVRVTSTAPELEVRRILSNAGVRYRINDKRLPGKPDIHIPRINVAILVHGCFWHGHSCTRGGMPKTNATFWEEKIAGNRARDARVIENLETIGVTPLTLWQCELPTKGRIILRRIVRKYRSAPAKSR